jgi:hypothetical protein
MNAIDPAVELVGRTLRTVVIALLEAGRVSLPVHASERMDERHLTGPQIESALRSGALASESCTGGTWRYRATRQSVVVIFAFDTDDDGNLLVVVTTWRTG